jgi:RNA polymerase sigma factor (sigma-70 family)
MSDERLARMVAQGSERAFVAIYERHSQPLYRYCRSIVGGDGEAQDALQSAFAGALVALRGGRRNAPLRPWLFRIAHNESITLLRRRRPVVELTEARHQAAPSVADQALGRERLDLLVSDLRELGDRQRGALLMRELSGLSHEEIALALGTSVGAAKQAIFEARRAMLELEEGRSMRCEEVRRMISDGDGRVLRARRMRGHLRDCAGCAAFAAAIPARRADLQAIAPPLAPIAAAGLLGHVLATGSSHGAGAGWLVAGATGKSAATALAAKALVGVVILTSATVGVSQVLMPGPHAHAHRVPASQAARSGASSGAAGRGSATPAAPARRPNSINSVHGRSLGSSAATKHSAKTRGGSGAKAHAPARGGRRSHVTPARGHHSTPKRGKAGESGRHARSSPSSAHGGGTRKPSASSPANGNVAGGRTGSHSAKTPAQPQSGALLSPSPAAPVLTTRAPEQSRAPAR